MVDPALPGHVLQLVWERLSEYDEREASDLPTVGPVLVDLLLSTVRIICVLEPVGVPNANVFRLRVGAFGKDHA